MNRTDRKDCAASLVKECPKCAVGLTLSDFLTKVEIEPIGMSIDPVDPELNFYYFNHECANCGTTFVVDVRAFVPCIDEPIPTQILHGSSVCGGHCTRIDDLAQCPNECLYAPFRRFLLRLRDKLSADSRSTRA